VFSPIAFQEFDPQKYREFVQTLWIYVRKQWPVCDCAAVAATAAAENMPVASVDQDFRKFPDVRIEV
jgi:hypothetical protein